MIRAFPIDCAALAVITVLMFLLAWSGVRITIAEVMYSWMLSLAFTRCVMTAYYLGKQHQEKGSVTTLSNAKGIDLEQPSLTEASDKSDIRNTFEHLSVSEQDSKNRSVNNQKSRQMDWNPMDDFT